MDKSQQSYRSILKSTFIIGGASIINMLIGLVRTKFVAVLLGPSGVGLLGMYVQISGIISTVFGMGLSTSGVRQVAESVGTGDDKKIARTVHALRRTVWVTGGAGMLVMFLASIPISQISFSSDEYGLPIAFLSVTILLASITSGQACILQGTRRIADLAKISIVGAANGAVLSIPCFYFWGEEGIVISLVLCAVASLVTSWWFARRVKLINIGLSWSESIGESRQMLVLGIGIMGAGLATALSSYLVRVVLLRQFSLGDVGIYQAAYVLAGILVGFVLSAMGTDYYPRLTSVAQDNEKVRQLVAEQSEISLLMALPLLLAMIIFAPFVIQILYTESFLDAIPVLRWCLFGVLGRVITWPLGFVILAKGRGSLFFVIELLNAIFHVVAVYFFSSLYGISGAGIAFMAMYSFHAVLMILVSNRLIGGGLNRRTYALNLAAIIFMSLIMYGNYLEISPVVRWSGNLTIMLIVSTYCLKKISISSGLGFSAILSKLRGD